MLIDLQLIIKNRDYPHYTVTAFKSLAAVGKPEDDWPVSFESDCKF